MNERTEQTYSVDAVMRNLACTLVSDFREHLNDPSFCSSHLDALSKGDITKIRQTSPEPTHDLDVYAFKASYQVASLLKRYRFEKDLYCDEELIQKSIMIFEETQHRIRAVDLSSLDAITSEILDRARIYISKVLGEYDDEECRSLCRFGKRASVGIPARMACEASRWELPISGSQNQIDWFDSEMSQIACVQEYWAKQKGSDLSRSTYRPIDSLTLALVPKSFKSFRSIMPNTTIGSYISFGLGEMMRIRLKENGYDIKSLQETHRDIARRGSVHGMYVTADLSSASDSISVALVERLLPASWFNILNSTRIGLVRLPDGRLVESDTFSTMGIGYTFPLQTLVFLSLLKAVHSLVLTKDVYSTISVYGDDMIYIKSLHPHVVELFGKIGFVLNVDKTFSEGNFRESCGGDYYHGVDVRPFQPRNGSAIVNRKTYEAVLYKLINGLSHRWSEYEIAGSLRYLLSEIRKVAKARIVPANFPDDSGIKSPDPSGPAFVQGRDDVAFPVSIGHGIFRFSYLRLKSEIREEVRHDPYYWIALRDVSRGPSSPSWRTLQDRPTALQKLIIVSASCSTYEPPFIQRAHKDLTVRSKITGRRLRRIQTFVTISHTGKYTRQSGTSCFGVPQR